MLFFGAASVAAILSITKGVLDPHFKRDGDFPPCARFEPTESGWNLALTVSGLLEDEAT